jgi:hypothetical protein
LEKCRPDFSRSALRSCEPPGDRPRLRLSIPPLSGAIGMFGSLMRQRRDGVGTTFGINKPPLASGQCLSTAPSAAWVWRTRAPSFGSLARRPARIHTELCGRSPDQCTSADRDSPRRKNGSTVSNPRTPTSSGPVLGTVQSRKPTSRKHAGVEIRVVVDLGHQNGTTGARAASRDQYSFVTDEATLLLLSDSLTPCAMGQCSQDYISV